MNGSTLITPVPLGASDWAPFGWLPLGDLDPHDHDHHLEFAWQDPHINVIGHARSEVTETADGLRCDELFHHDTHTQAITPLDGPAVIVVAPKGVTFADPEDQRAIRAFFLEPLQSIVLHRGTWHWGPYPRFAEAVRLLNVQGYRYAEDNIRVDLGNLGLAVTVPVN